MKKNKSKLSNLSNNFFLGTLLAALVTGIYLYILVVVGQFSKIDALIFTRIILVLILVLLVLNIFYFLGYSKRIIIFRKIFFTVGVVMLGFGLLGGFYLYRTNSSLNKLINVDTFETVEYAVIGFDDGDTLEAMDKGVLGFIEHDEEFDKLMQDAIRPHSRVVKYMEFPDYHSMLEASLKGEIQYALVPKDYSRLEESFEVLEAKEMPLTNAHTLFNFTTKVDEDKANVEVLDHPFSILLLGNNGGLSDSIIVATVNPQTLNVTMTSLARDSYLPIACYPNQGRDKLNHARARGRQCIEDTIENYLDIKLDFYFETDFYALQKIVDALGGLELDSPIGFGGSLPKENNPKEYHEVWVPQGTSLMDGKQAITFARERHRMPRGDFDRQINQQYVIKEVANAIIRERNPEKLVSALEGASENIKTNLSINTITQLLGYAIQQIDASPLDAMNTFRIESSQIMGTTPMIGKMSVIVPYKNDVLAAQALIKANLIEQPSLKNIRGFSFNVNEPYQTPTQKRSPWGDQSAGTISIGNEVVGNMKPDPEVKQEEAPKVEVEKIVVPSFTDQTKFTRVDLEAWAKSNNIKLNVTIVHDEKYKNGQVVHQDYAGKTINKSLLDKGLNVTIAEVESDEDKIDVGDITTKDQLIAFYAGHKIDITSSISEEKTDAQDKDGLLTKPFTGQYTLNELKAMKFKFYKFHEQTDEVETP